MYMSLINLFVTLIVLYLTILSIILAIYKGACDKMEASSGNYIGNTELFPSEEQAKFLEEGIQIDRANIVKGGVEEPIKNRRLSAFEKNLASYKNAKKILNFITFTLHDRLF